MLKTIINLTRSLDAIFGFNSYVFGKKFYNGIDSIINSVYRIIDKIRIISRWNILGNKPIKLHLGCGKQHKDGYVNIDWRKTNATDYVCDIRKLPFRPNTINQIESYHVIEHLARQDAINTLKNWHSLLNNGGKIVIECPDFDEAVKEYLNGNLDRINNIFGHQRFSGDAHLFGYNFKRLKEMLTSIGFINIKSTEPQDYHVNEEPCLRIEAIKK
jgi:predicted SAM-dependent methyltransferase